MSDEAQGQDDLSADNLPDNQTGDDYSDDVDGSGLPGDEEDTGEQEADQLETEEVEFNGKKVKIPAELKPAFLMQADYTRKTQELAENRRAFDAERQQAAQISQAVVQAQAAVMSLDQQLNEYSQINWQQLADSDPNAAQKLWFQFSQLRDARQQAATQAAGIEQHARFSEQQRLQKLAEEGTRALQEQIPGWSIDMGRELGQNALKEYGALGLQPHMLEDVHQPVIVHILRDAMAWRNLQASQKATSKQTAVAKPVPSVQGQNAPVKKDPAKMSTDDWMKARNAQLQKNRRR